MKLNCSQLATLESALALYVEKCEGRAEFAVPEDTFWKEELASAQDLHALFHGTYDVTVEEPSSTAAQSTPAVDACGDINCDGRCQTKPEPAPAKPEPALLTLIDNAASWKDAKKRLEDATPKQRRETAQHLGIGSPDLCKAIRLRVRQRLGKAA